jgi:hypothetical protein
LAGCVFTVSNECLREGSHLEDLEVDVRIIFKWIFGKNVMIWAGLIWLRVWTSGGICEHRNETTYVAVEVLSIRQESCFL